MTTDQKKEIRQEVKRRRAEALPETLHENSLKIKKTFVELEVYKNAALLLAYVDAKREVETRLLMEQAWKDGKKVVDETQRMAIEADTTFGEPRDDAGMKGLATARAIGLLSYRGPEGYNLTQQDREEAPAVHRACTYQQYQGEKLCRRYNAYSYYAILNAFDTHDAGRGRGGVERALAGIEARTLVVGITTDIIFTPAEMRRLHAMIPGSTYHEIDSPFGHDGFLVEYKQLNEILLPFMQGESFHVTQ